MITIFIVIKWHLKIKKFYKTLIWWERKRLNVPTSWYGYEVKRKSRIIDNFKFLLILRWIIVLFSQWKFYTEMAFVSIEYFESVYLLPKITIWGLRQKEIPYRGPVRKTQDIQLIIHHSFYWPLGWCHSVSLHTTEEMVNLWLFFP